MKVTFEMLKQAMLDDGWTYEQNVVAKTGSRGSTWNHVFTKDDKCWYSDGIWWHYKFYGRSISLKKLYKKITKKPLILKIKKVYPGIELPTPTYATDGSAGIDLCVVLQGVVDIVLEEGELLLFHTGIAVAIPKGYVGLIVPRSGLGTKGIVLGNLTGVIDSDYRGEIMLQLWNRSDQPQTINHLDRVAQMLIVPVAQPRIEVVDELDSTERGEGGFGSTGK